MPSVAELQGLSELNKSFLSVLLFAENTYPFNEKKKERNIGAQHYNALQLSLPNTSRPLVPQLHGSLLAIIPTPLTTSTHPYKEPSNYAKAPSNLHWL